MLCGFMFGAAKVGFFMNSGKTSKLDVNPNIYLHRINNPSLIIQFRRVLQRYRRERRIFTMRENVFCQV